MTRVDRLQRWIDELQPRERWTLIAMVLVVVVVFWDALMRQPMAKQLAQLDTRREALETEIEGYQRALKVIAENQQPDRDPVAEARARIGELQSELAALDDQARSLTSSGVVTPNEMSVALKEILALNRDLTLVRLRNLPAEPVLSPSEALQGRGARADSGPKLYRHTVELELEGSYLDTLAYLQALEQLSWRLIWEQLELVTEQYPRARVRLVISTLSLRAGLVGV